MTLAATYESANARVKLDVTAIPVIPNLPVYLERQLPGSNVWEPVRGAFPAVPKATTLTIYDYEFTPNVLNSYRARTDARYDAFGRTVANGWGSADSGQAWTTTGGAASDYAVGSGYSSQLQNTTGVVREASLTAVSTDVDVIVDVGVSATTTVQPVFGVVSGRRTDVNNVYELQLSFNIDNTITVTLARRLAGAVLSLATFTPSLTYVAGGYVRTRLRVFGTFVQAKVWRTIDPEPSVWQASVTNSALVTGTGVALWSFRSAGNTNAGLTVRFDNLRVADLSAVTAGIASLGTATTTPAFATDEVWLKFPLLPFLNRRVTLCNWTPETERARGAVHEVLGRRLPVAVTDVRGSREFDVLLNASDNVEAEAMELALSFGDVALLQTPGPTTTCILTRRSYPRQGYFYVSDAVFGRTVDSPVAFNQTITLPLREVAQPSPSVVGTSVTWQGIINAFATWTAVQAQFATWAAVQAYNSDPGDEIVGG